MKNSESIKAISAALCKVHAEVSNPGFDAKNPHFKSKYASLASVRAAVLPILSANDLCVTQLLCNSENGDPACETVILHKSGEFISQTFSIPSEKKNAHGYGSAITYLRRYSLQAVCGVVGDDDDDGNATVVQPTEVISRVRASLKGCKSKKDVQELGLNEIANIEKLSATDKATLRREFEARKAEFENAV